MTKQIGDYKYTRSPYHKDSNPHHNQVIIEQFSYSHFLLQNEGLSDQSNEYEQYYLLFIIIIITIMYF